MSAVTLSISQLNALAREKGLTYGEYCARYGSKPIKGGNPKDIKELINSRPIINLVDDDWRKIFRTILAGEDSTTAAVKIGITTDAARKLLSRKSAPKPETAMKAASVYGVWIGIGDIYSSDTVIYDQRQIIDDLTSDISKQQALCRGVTLSQWIAFRNRKNVAGLITVNAVGKAANKKILLG